MLAVDTNPHPEFLLEEAHLAQTIAAMLRQIEFWEDRERQMGADLETSVLMGDQAEEHAALLSPHVQAPYFGSMTVRVAGREQVLYLGKHAFRDVKGPCSVISWESEVGALFYREQLSWTPKRGSAGVVRRKRQLDVAAKVLRGVTDLYDEANGGETGGRAQVLLERLGQGSQAGMRDVVETLQPEQDQALRSAAGEALVIQGPAGSGKTTIGFHRLAWLVHPERGAQRARPEACMVLMPNGVLARYAARILPELGLSGVKVTTPEDWAVGLLGLEKLEVTDRTLQLLLTDQANDRRRLAWQRAKVLGEARWYAAVQRHLWERLTANLRGLAVQEVVHLSGREVKVNLDDAALAGVLRAVFRADPASGYRAAYRAALEAELLGQVNEPGQERAVLAQLQGALSRVLGRVFGGLAPVLETRRLLGDEAALHRAGLAEKDVSLVLSDPLQGIPRPRRGHADVTELPIMLTMQAMLGGIGRREGHQLETFDHVVLDEAQDYPPLLYRLLLKCTRRGHLTALGDLNQGMHGYKGPSSWAAVQEQWPGAGVVTLGRTYRSTQPITALCARIAATYQRAAPVQGVERSGAAVQRYHGGEETALLAQAVKEAQAAGHITVAIVTRRTIEAERLATALREHDVDAQPITGPASRYEGGVVILPVNLAKGLEFSAAVVAGCDAAHYNPETEFERRLLYVACSRALHWLAVVSTDELHPLVHE